MIYLAIKHSDGSVSSAECQNWKELSNTLDEALDVFEVERVNVTQNKQSHFDKMGEWLE